MIVVDASALTELLTETGALGRAVRTMLREDLEWWAPDHVSAEVFSAVRGRFLGGRLSRERAERAIREFRSFGVRVLDTRELMGRMWELRENATGYDAAYVAAAERHGCALVTTDRKLAAVPGAHCEIRLVLPTS